MLAEAAAPVVQPVDIKQKMIQSNNNLWIKYDHNQWLQILPWCTWNRYNSEVWNDGSKTGRSNSISSRGQKFIRNCTTQLRSETVLLLLHALRRNRHCHLQFDNLVDLRHQPKSLPAQLNLKFWKSWTDLMEPTEIILLRCHHVSTILRWIMSSVVVTKNCQSFQACRVTRQHKRTKTMK